jgi:hypothetical protein
MTVVLVAWESRPDLRPVGGLVVTTGPPSHVLRAVSSLAMTSYVSA